MQLQNCRHCGVQVVPAADGTCPNCRYSFYAPTYQGEDLGDSAAVRMLIPVGLSVWAIFAGYLGLVSVLVIPPPFAVLCGILALREIKRNPKKHGMGRAIFGIVCGVSVMGLLAVILTMGLASAN